MGRGLNFKTILTQFYVASEVEERDGIGKTWNHLKSGPTYVAASYSKVLEIISNPVSHLWAAESSFQNSNSTETFKLYSFSQNGIITFYRSMGRQDTGECDRFGIASYYTEFQRSDRSAETLQKLANAVQFYIGNLITTQPSYTWDYFTYVSDKVTTTPPDKMRNFFNLIDVPLTKLETLKWSETVDGTIRNMVNYKLRRGFISQNLKVLDNIDLNGKSLIILDDQFTTGGTAFEIVDMFRQRGVKNVLFLTLFFMVSMVSSNRDCPKCGKKMQVKIRKSDGHKFYSCTPPQYRGTGCGHAENV